MSQSSHTKPSLYQRWYEGGDIYELAKEYGVTLQEAYRHIVAETKGEADPVLQVAAASFAKEIGCSEQVASLALSDRGQEAISLHINEADLTEEQLSVLLYLVVDATYWVKS